MKNILFLCIGFLNIYSNILHANPADNENEINDVRVFLERCNYIQVVEFKDKWKHNIVSTIIKGNVGAVEEIYTQMISDRLRRLSKIDNLLGLMFYIMEEEGVLKLHTVAFDANGVDRKFKMDINEIKKFAEKQP